MRRTPISRSHVSSMTREGCRTLLSRSHVSSMTGECTYPIYYQRVVSLEKGSVIIRYPLPELTQKVSDAANPALPQPCFKHDYGGESNLLSRSHVSSMTGGCTFPIYYPGVVSVEKGRVIIRYTLAQLSKSILDGEPPSCSDVSSITTRGVEPSSPAAMFQA